MQRTFLLSLVFCSSLVGQVGQLSVSVKDDSGAFVSAALITVSPRPMYGGSNSKPVPLSYHFTGKSGTNGLVSVPNVPEGVYTVCGRLPGSLLVDSCSWYDNPLTTFVKAGNTAAVTILMKKGARVVVQVNDSLGLLAFEPFPGHRLRLAVGSAGGQRIPMTISQQGSSRQFSAVVPVDTDLKLQVRSETLQVADANGSKLDMKDIKAFIPLRVAASAAQALGATQPLGATPAIQIQLGLVGHL